MIIIGYPGIGKSTASRGDITYIDLESGNFWIGGKRADDWHKPYCKIAEDLSGQGYNVFVSSHELVRKELEQSNETIALIYPAIELKAHWIDKLEKRYLKSGSEKDYKAYVNVRDHYDDNIRELESTPFTYKVPLKKEDYELKRVLAELRMLLYSTGGINV